ncbi:MAG: phenylalanine--tRNA ligase subunit alpha [Candidatus Eremiobacteraeota bacterium]|nr:phenylalanine--tRNA ligase subunit alpha [Candidatus Eremiobacteraeota bacterium]
MGDLEQQLQQMRARFDEALASAQEGKAIDAVRVTFLGRNGEVTKVRRTIGSLPADERPNAGRVINDAVASMEAALDRALRQSEAHAFDAALQQSIDVTFPAHKPRVGSIHPIRRVMDDIASYFRRHGFAIVLGPEAEPDYYNFDALNIPTDHPAREGFDSFYLSDNVLLRPHTSPMQIRTLEAYPPPVAVIVPGKCYRRDAVDARHSFMFHQVEGLLVGKAIHFGHLKGMLIGMCRELFGADTDVRFRPSYFPFTEPSAEVDARCPVCQGEGGACRMCGGAGWIELGGSGMVHPNVLSNLKYDPDVYSGWAFGFGLERIALRRYGIDDIRRFFENDPQFLEQLAW